MHLCTMIQVKLHKLIGDGHLQVLNFARGTLKWKRRERAFCISEKPIAAIDIDFIWKRNSLFYV